MAGRFTLGSTLRLPQGADCWGTEPQQSAPPPDSRLCPVQTPAPPGGCPPPRSERPGQSLHSGRESAAAAHGRRPDRPGPPGRSGPGFPRKRRMCRDPVDPSQRPLRPAAATSASAPRHILPSIPHYAVVLSARSYSRGPCFLPVTARLESVTVPLHLRAGQPWASPILAYQQCRVTDGQHPIQDYRGLFQRPKMTAPPWARFGPRGRALAPLRRCSAQQGFWPSAGLTSPPGPNPQTLQKF